MPIRPALRASRPLSPRRTDRSACPNARERPGASRDARQPWIAVHERPRCLHRATATSLPSRSRSAIRAGTWPLWRVEKIAGPSDREVRVGDPEAVGRLDHRREPRLALHVASARASTQRPRLAPRPTRPRSWCGCARPKRSACSITMRLAFGVHAHLDHRRRDQDLRLARAKRSIAACRSAAPCRPCTRSTRACGKLRALRSAESIPERRSIFSLSSTRGQTT